jgi:hypothetical protein
MGIILRKIRVLRVAWVVVFGLITGFNCDFFKERITIEPVTRISNLFFLDSANIVYVKTTYDIRWSLGPFGGNAFSSEENFHSTLELLNFYSTKKDTLLTLPDPSPDSYSEPQLSIYFPIILISPVALRDNAIASLYYNIETKISGTYSYRNQLMMSDLPDAAYDTRGNIVNPVTDKVLFSLPDTGIDISYYSARTNTAIFYTDAVDSLQHRFAQPWFGKYNMISNSLQSEKIDQSLYYHPRTVDHADYLLFETFTPDSITLKIIHRDSLTVALEKGRSVLIKPRIWGDICDANISREWLLIRDDTTMVVRNFKGEVIFGPLGL